MVQLPDTHESHHDVVITIDADDEPSRCCCVCTDPLEWVAVGPCGHRDVCAGCATRIRFFSGDRRCCVCRTPCPTVVVTKAGAAGARERDFHYYHSPTGARFDSRRQYRKAVKTCAVKPAPPCPPAANPGAAAAVNNSLGAPPSSSQPAGGVSVNLDAPRPPPPVVESCLACAAFFVGVYLSLMLILVTMFGIFFKVSENYHQKVATVVLFGLFSAAATICAIWSWVRVRGHPNSDA